MRALTVCSALAVIAGLAPQVAIGAPGESAGLSPWPLIVELGVAIVVVAVLVSRRAIARGGRALGHRAAALRPRLHRRAPTRPRIGGI
jgi:hypothetical protein